MPDDSSFVNTHLRGLSKIEGKASPIPVSPYKSYQLIRDRNTCFFRGNLKVFHDTSVCFCLQVETGAVCW